MKFPFWNRNCILEWNSCDAFALYDLGRRFESDILPLLWRNSIHLVYSHAISERLKTTLLFYYQERYTIDQKQVHLIKTHHPHYANHIPTLSNTTTNLPTPLIPPIHPLTITPKQYSPSHPSHQTLTHPTHQNHPQLTNPSPTKPPSSSSKTTPPKP